MPQKIECVHAYVVSLLQLLAIQGLQWKSVIEVGAWMEECHGAYSGRVQWKWSANQIEIMDHCGFP